MERKSMPRVDALWRHPLYQENLKKNEKAEENRKFCHHDMTHFLDVARIAWIMVLEEDTRLDRELVYAAALLHDCGRHLQYSRQIPHEQASAQIAPDILRDCGFSEEEIKQVTEAIAGHRQKESSFRQDLTGILYRADKASRACFGCKAEEECNWKNDKKNRQINY